MVAFNTPSPHGTTFSGVVGQQLTGGLGNDLTGRSLEARSSREDRSLLLLGTNSDMMWRQSIDVNGDGRLDLIDAQESAGGWVVYLNTPSIDDPESHSVGASQNFDCPAGATSPGGRTRRQFRILALGKAYYRARHQLRNLLGVAERSYERRLPMGSKGGACR